MRSRLACCPAGDVLQAGPLLVLDGPLRNRPRDQHGVDLLEGRPVRTAIVFEPR